MKKLATFTLLALMISAGPAGFAASAATKSGKPPRQCICAPGVSYKICLEPQMGEDGPFPIKNGVQLRGPMGFRSAKNNPGARSCPE